MIANLNYTRQIWWTNPAWIGGLMCSVIAVVAYLIPDGMYRESWRTPKFFSLEPLLLSLAFTGLFVLGVVAAAGKHKRQATKNWKDSLPWELINASFWFCIAGTIVGYAFWAWAAISRGANLNIAMGVLRGEKGAATLMKDVYMGTISGVTTLAQLGLAAVVLGVMIGAAQGWKKVRWPLALIFALAVLRSLFNSERLAIIELALPGIVLMLRLIVLESPRYQGRLRTMLQFAPVAGGACLLVIFAGFEYLRSWSTFYAGGDMPFWEFVLLRLLGYYVTALNNGALIIARLDSIGGPFMTLHFLWRFPGLNTLTHLIYPNVALENLEIDPIMQLLDREANPEFNNASGLMPPMIDFGVIGALLFWLSAGLICGLVYRWFSEGRTTGLFIYPLLFTGVVEMTRITYWGEGRVVVAYLVLIPLAYLCSGWERRIHTRIGVGRRLAWQQSH